MSEKMPDLLKAREVAEVFRVDENTVYQWGSRGVIQAVRIGSVVRFPRSEVERLLKGKRNDEHQRDGN